MALWRALLVALENSSPAAAAGELCLLAAPLWVAVLAGLLLGWAWRPEWARCLCAVSDAGGPAQADEVGVAQKTPADGTAPATTRRKEPAAVEEDDLHHLCRLVDEQDGGPSWIKMMEKSLPTMSYQAWRRDMEVGPPQYRSSTVFEDAEPEEVKDFFWDDGFRTKNGWDNMLLVHEILEECASTGTLVVRWVRKFPFFCSDREYIIGRRIWQTGRTCYCVTKGVQRPDIPRHNKPRRVDLYYSSWCIRPVESKRGTGQMTACEVLLFHHEDMGIPYELAKLGIRQGMWGCVRRIEPGLRAYQAARGSGEPLSRYASVAQLSTKFDMEDVAAIEESTDGGIARDIVAAEKGQPWTRGVRRLVVIGGAVALACTLDRGLVTKAVIFGVARKFVQIGRRF